MNYGLYLSAAGALTNLTRMDAIANNLANVETNGFRPTTFAFAQRRPERLEDPAVAAMLQADPQTMLEKLGGGTLAARMTIDDRPGPVKTTGNPLDVAIDGDGYLAVRVTQGRTTTTRYTRDGRLTIDSQKRLATVSGGHAVLDDSGRPITLTGTGDIEIGSDGRIRQNGQDVARLGLQGFDAISLKPADGNTLATEPGARSRPATGRFIAGAVEGSGVDPVTALSTLMSTSRSFQANVRMMQYHDELMDQAINRLGRVV